MKLTDKYQKTLSKSEKIIYDYYLQLKKKVNIINAEEQSQQNIVNKDKNQSPNKKPPHDIS